jgi:uncharacterized phage protein gp47/JayE
VPQPIPGLDEIHERLLDDARGRFAGWNFSRHSDNWKRLRVVAGGLLGTYHHLSILDDDFWPDTAEGSALDRWGVIYELPRKGATPARKSDALRVFGSAASTVVVGDELTVNGLLFQVNEADAVDAIGYVDVDVVAVSTGSQTRILAETELVFSSPPAGINATAELQLDLDEGGEDAERDADYRVRILDRIAFGSAGGNANDYKQWAREVDDIASAYVYPNRRGLGSVDLAVLHAGSGSVRLPTATKRQEVFDYIDNAERRPIAMKNFRLIEVTELQQVVDLQVHESADATRKWDWDDETPPTVAAWTAGTRTLQLSTSRPGDMEVGDRIILATVAGDGDGAEIEIEAFGGGADEIVLVESDVPSPAPQVGDTIYSGGDLVAPVRGVVLAHMDNLGPAVGDDGTGEWEDSLQPRRLEQLALFVTGVRSTTCITPATDQTPEDPQFPNDTTLELLTPGEVVVRRKH